MLTCTITNVSSVNVIGTGTLWPLPAPFDWFTIAGSGTKAITCRVQDLAGNAGGRLSGFTVADALQRMVQSGLITVSFANLAATLPADVSGDSISNET